jgi:hypothetical protein
MRVRLGALAAIAICIGGCVEREITINTQPQGALISLNDEEIGLSPVTVSFEWYGDYNISASKEGYQTLTTHHELKGPWYDSFPFDFFAQVIIPKRIVNSYQWSFELPPQQEVNRQDLIDRAASLSSQM